jgi:hypothetical protein
MVQFVFLLFATLLVAPPFTSADDCAPKGVTEITITPAKGEALAKYQLGEAVSCLKLSDRGAVRKLTWQMQTEGALLSDDGNIVRFAAPRMDFSVRLRAFERDCMVDRAYSPVIAFGDGSAVAVYTDYLRPQSTKHGVFLAFSGFAPTEPARDVGPQHIGNEQTYIVVGEPTLSRRNNVVAVVDQSTPAWLLRRVTNEISQGEVALRGLSATQRPLTYLITYTQPGGTERAWRGDASDTLVRLNFMGASWQHEQPDMHDLIDQFVLHELFHTASAPALDPRLPSAMSLSEGGAEAGAMAMRHGAASATQKASV